MQCRFMSANKPFYNAFIDSRQIVYMLLNQRVAGATDALHDQEYKKQGNSWQLSQRED